MEGYKKELVVIDLVKANVYAILSILPIAIIYLTPYLLIWGWPEFDGVEPKGFFSGSFLFLIVYIVGIVIHELLHGVMFARYAKNGFGSVKFGILKKMLTPYCHCKEPLQVNQYIQALFAPNIVLGFVPAILAIAIGNLQMLAFAAVFTFSGMGDFMIFNLIRKEASDTWVQDHPTEGGCWVYRKEE